MTESPPGAEAPYRRGMTVPYRGRRLIKNVKLYLAQLCSNPVHATAAAVHINRNTVSKIIKEEVDASSSRRGRKAASLDSMDKSQIYGIVHQYFLRNEPPTVKKLLATVKQELGDRFHTERSSCSDSSVSLDFDLAGRMAVTCT